MTSCSLSNRAKIELSVMLVPEPNHEQEIVDFSTLPRGELTICAARLNVVFDVSFIIPSRAT